MNAFGAYVRQLRAERRLPLRTFAEAVQMDPANYSKVELGRLAPPTDPERLRRFCTALGLRFDGPEFREMTRLAAIDRGEIPPRLLTDKELAGRLPALFRSIEGDPVDETRLDDLIGLIRREG